MAEPIVGKFQEYSFQALKEERRRSIFQWKGSDSDNGSEFINDILYKYGHRQERNSPDLGQAVRMTTPILRRRTGPMSGRYLAT